MSDRPRIDTPAPVLNSESVVQTGRAEVIPTGESSLRVRIPPLSDPAAPAPDAATVDQIMALADDYASMAQFSATWQIEERKNDTARPRAALRAAVEQLMVENEAAVKVESDLRQYWFERAERAEGERDGFRRLADIRGDALTDLERTVAEWLKANGPGGWIDELRKENAILIDELEDARARAER